MIYLPCKLIEPYGAVAVPEQNSPPEQKHELHETISEKTVSHRRSNSSLRSTSPDIDSKDIKNIYVDSKLISLSVPFHTQYIGNVFGTTHFACSFSLIMLCLISFSF